MVSQVSNYQPQAEDTTIATDCMVFFLLRSRSVQQRLSMGASLMRSARNLSLSALKQQYGHFSPAAFARKVAEAWLQEFCPRDYVPTGDCMSWVQDSIALAGVLHPILEALKVRYYITGGVAAIAYGEPRTTQDLDLVLEVEAKVLDVLVAALTEAGFYVPGVEDVPTLGILQVTHMESIARADLMVAGADEWEQTKLERRLSFEIDGLGALFFISPEDLILSKLLWGKRSQSQKQWRDVAGVLKVKLGDLDLEYLREWGECLDVGSLLARAINEAS